MSRWPVPLNGTAVRPRSVRMNPRKIRELVHRKSGVPAVHLSRRDLANLEPALEDRDIREYLLECLPAEVYEASGVRILNLSRIFEECFELVPGARIRPFDYIPIASSIGGNLIAVHAWGDRRAKVYWVDHAGWYDDTISYQDRTTGSWRTLEGYTPEHVETAMVPLAHNLESFLIKLLTDELTDDLDALD
jgi:hypothetical protein